MSAVAYRNHDRELPPEVVIEDWEPTIRTELSDAEIEAWIAEFAETGDVADELGSYKSHLCTVTHSCAQQWVADKEKLSGVIGPVFWRWSRAAAYIALVGV